jgi:DNA gyrase subunit B
VDGDGEEVERLFYTEEQYDAFIQELVGELGAEGKELQMIEPDDLEVPEPEDLRNSVRPERIEEAARVEALVRAIEDSGIPIRHLYAAGEEEDGRFVVRANGTERECSSLLGLMPIVGELGRQGLDIQRYKGLGEMDAAELAETTLAPGTRRAAQVTIGDAIRADNYFSILAGKDVKQRREFIERHALEVSNLDV